MKRRPLRALAAAGLVVAGFYERSIVRLGSGLEEVTRDKHTVNMCQVYAFGFQQRHPEWTASPWLACGELMRATFGKPDPTLAEMARANPRAVIGHLAWNVGLVPGGISLLLFNEAAGRVNPDYAPARLGSARARALAIVLAAVWVVGLWLLFRDRRYWWDCWLRARAIGWLAMLSTVPVAALVVATQRPRPSYLFVHGLLLMALTETCVMAIGRRIPGMSRLASGILAPVMPAVMVGLILLAPSRYHAYARPRPLLTLYERLAPYGPELRANRFMVSAYVMEVHGYVAHDAFANPFANLDYSALGQGPIDPRALGGLLDAKGVRLLYVDEALWRRLGSARIDGWQPLASEDTDRARWALLIRR